MRRTTRRIGAPGRPGLDRTLLGLLLFATAKVAFHLVVNTRYGFHRDELATLDDARHLAWGYVAYPPLTPFLGRVELALFGASLTGFRLLAAVAQSIACVVAGRMARRFGGGAGAQWLAALAVAIAPLSMGASSLFQYVSFDYLWWVLIAWFLVRRIDEEERRWWLAIGAVIGLAVLTKYSIVFCVAGLAVGVLATPLRRDLRGRWPWLGAAIAVAVAMPNLVWQARHELVSLDFLRHIHARDVAIGRTDGFLVGQLWVTTNPVTVPLWVLGLWALLRVPRLRPFRALAWMAIVPALLFLLARGRDYYLGGVYPMLLAAGATVVIGWLGGRPAPVRRVGWATVAVLLAAGFAATMVAMPIAPVGSPLFRFAARANGDLVEELGWPELVAEVARIWNALPAGERARTAIYAANYGEAGAVNLYGPAHGLPAAISGVNSFWERGYGDPPPEQLVVLGGSRERLEQRCREVTLVGHTPNPYGVVNEETGDHPDIFLCRGLRMPWERLWPQLRHFG
jgi:4-amino-4-deoxy-L-arabinose transferase-like glycosyltransferase